MADVKEKETDLLEEAGMADDGQVELLGAQRRRTRRPAPHVVQDELDLAVGHALRHETLGVGAVAQQFAHHAPPAQRRRLQFRRRQHGRRLEHRPQRRPRFIRPPWLAVAVAVAADPVPSVFLWFEPPTQAWAGSTEVSAAGTR